MFCSAFQDTNARFPKTKNAEFVYVYVHASVFLLGSIKKLALATKAQSATEAAARPFPPCSPYEACVFR